jgi:hypothetical protein
MSLSAALWVITMSMLQLLLLHCCAADCPVVCVFGLGILVSSFVTHYGDHAAAAAAAAALQIVLSCVFGLDILVSFFVGYYDSHGLLVMQNLPVALYYIRWAALCEQAVIYGECLLIVAAGLGPSAALCKCFADAEPAIAVLFCAMSPPPLYPWSTPCAVAHHNAL